jgi:hypothetical protein
MSEINREKDGWFPDGLNVIPFGVRLDAVAAFLSGLVRQGSEVDYSEHARGAEAMLVAQDEQPTLFDVWKSEGHQSVAADKLHQANLSGMGYEPE